MLGIAVAVALGYGIYRGGVRLNLSKFFRATGLVLVLVAAGLVVNALHTAHEAGWLDAGQGSPVDLTWLVQPGTVQASLLTGMLGIQPQPVVDRGRRLAALPRPGRPLRRLAARTAACRPGRWSAAALAVGALAGVAAVVLALVAPPRPRPGRRRGRRASPRRSCRAAATGAVVRTQQRSPSAAQAGAAVGLRLTVGRFARHGGVDARDVHRDHRGRAVAGRPARLTSTSVAALNGGRLPDRRRTGHRRRCPTTYRDAPTLTVWLDVRTDRVVDLSGARRVTAVVAGTATGRSRWPRRSTTPRPLPAAASARSPRPLDADAHAGSTGARRLHAPASWCVGAGGRRPGSAALGFWPARRRRARRRRSAADPMGQARQS